MPSVIGCEDIGSMTHPHPRTFSRLSQTWKGTARISNIRKRSRQLYVHARSSPPSTTTCSGSRSGTHAPNASSVESVHKTFDTVCCPRSVVAAHLRRTASSHAPRPPNSARSWTIESGAGLMSATAYDTLRAMTSFDHSTRARTRSSRSVSNHRTRAPLPSTAQSFSSLPSFSSCNAVLSSLTNRRFLSAVSNSQPTSTSSSLLRNPLHSKASSAAEAADGPLGSG